MLGAIISLTAKGLLQPLITVPALICTFRFPHEINGFAGHASRYLGSDVAHALHVPLACLAVVGTVLHISGWLSRQAANNWTRDSTYDWQRELVLVTGGSSGLGLSITKQFASKGIKVVNIDINEPPADALASTKFYKADLTSWEQVSEVANQIKKEDGNPSVLINNAGLTARPLLLPSKTHNNHEEASDRLASFERVISVNLTAHLRLALQFVPSMISANHGHIVTIASGMAYLGTSPSNDYCVSKAACSNLHEALAMELRNAHKADKIRNTIYFPSWIRTPLAQSRIDAGVIPSGQLLEVDDVARTVVAQVLSGESGGPVSLPAALGIFASLKGWPLWMQNLVKQVAFSRIIPRRPDLATWDDVITKGVH